MQLKVREFTTLEQAQTFANNNRGRVTTREGIYYVLYYLKQKKKVIVFTPEERSRKAKRNKTNRKVNDAFEKANAGSVWYPDRNNITL